MNWSTQLCGQLWQLQPQGVMHPSDWATGATVPPAAADTASRWYRQPPGLWVCGRGSDCRWARLPTPQNAKLVILLPSQPGRDVHLEPDIRTGHRTYGYGVRVPARCNALSDRTSAYILGGKNGHLGRF